jgi:hypothetical protein
MYVYSCISIYVCVCGFKGEIYVCVFASGRASLPCGSACLVDTGGADPMKCMELCTNSAHYESTSTGEEGTVPTGRCMLKACGERQVNNSFV